MSESFASPNGSSAEVHDLPQLAPQRSAGFVRHPEAGEDLLVEVARIAEALECNTEAVRRRPLHRARSRPVAALSCAGPSAARVKGI